MSFMQRQIDLGDWYVCETIYGTEIVDVELVNARSNEDLQMYCEGTVESFELVKNKFGARLSAPGYMDRTDWVIFDTRKEAQEYLDETYPEDDD